MMSLGPLSQKSLAVSKTVIADKNIEHMQLW